MCSNKTNLPNTENITFPLTLQEAVHLLAHQRTENIENFGYGKRNSLYNKTWQQLSVRLRLIFARFPETQSRGIYTCGHEENVAKIYDQCLRHNLSKTRVDNFYKKLQYVYCAVTMWYIQHKDSPLNTDDVPSKWIKRKWGNDIDLRRFFQSVEDMCNIFRIKPESAFNDEEILKTESESFNLDGLSLIEILKLLSDCEKLVTDTYERIVKAYISPRQMQSLLSGIKEYSKSGKNQRLFENLFQDKIKQKLRKRFSEYDNFCGDIKVIFDIFYMAANYISTSDMGFKLIKDDVLPTEWDENSKTKTEISQLEFEFLSYLLEKIPTRKEGGGNITHQLSLGKWEVLSNDVREKICKYISEMKVHPKRLARFFGIEITNEKTIDLLKKEIEDTCSKILCQQHSMS